MKAIVAILIMTIGFVSLKAQTKQAVLNPQFDQKISETLSFTVPIIHVEEFKKIHEKCIILDAREKAEFNISHIPNAKNIGYDYFEIENLLQLNREETIVIYCSIGYRSEKIGEKLLDAGFTKVYNLYGSIFEWANQGNKLIDNQGKDTHKVHTYNKAWSKWVNHPNVKKYW